MEISTFLLQSSREATTQRELSQYIKNALEYFDLYKIFQCFFIYWESFQYVVVREHGAFLLQKF